MLKEDINREFIYDYISKGNLDYVFKEKEYLYKKYLSKSENIYTFVQDSKNDYNLEISIILVYLMSRTSILEVQNFFLNDKQNIGRFIKEIQEYRISNEEPNENIIEELKKDNKVLSNKVSDLEFKNQEKSNLCVNYQKDNISLKKKIENYKKDIKNFNKQLLKVNNLNSEINNSNAELRNIINNLNSEIIKLKQDKIKKENYSRVLIWGNIDYMILQRYSNFSFIQISGKDITDERINSEMKKKYNKIFLVLFQNTPRIQNKIQQKIAQVPVIRVNSMDEFEKELVDK